MVAEVLVDVDSQQNHTATAARADMTYPARPPSACSKMAITAGMLLPPESAAPSTDGISCIESVRAMSSRYPTAAEITTELSIPQGTRRRGSTVSSETCADAS